MSKEEDSGHEFLSKQRVWEVGSCAGTIIPKPDGDAALLSPNFTHNSHYLDTRSVHYIQHYMRGSLASLFTAQCFTQCGSLGGSWHWPWPSQEVSSLLASLSDVNNTALWGSVVCTPQQQLRARPRPRNFKQTIPILNTHINIHTFVLEINETTAKEKCFFLLLFLRFQWNLYSGTFIKGYIFHILQVFVE